MLSLDDVTDVQFKLIYSIFRVKPNLFTYAGTKDRRAKTSQEVTAYR